MSHQFPLIAGRQAGKRIFVVPAFQPAYHKLQKAAQKGSHWARLAVAGLHALSSSRLGKNNIFVKPTAIQPPHADRFYVVLPGCRATVERRPNDDYVVTNLTLDSAYFEMSRADKATGLYQVEKGDEGWRATSVKSGQLGKSVNPRKLVGISDGNYENANKAADSMSHAITQSPEGGGSAFFKEFHMHYTEGTGSIGGLTNYKRAISPLTNDNIHGSAIMLAHTMLKAKDTEGITWVADLGGAAVLTQAMKILADQNVKLSNHAVFLNRPSTSVDQAVAQAHALDMTMNRNFVKTKLGDYIGNRSQLKMIYRRYKNTEVDDAYGLKKAGWDVVGQVGSLQGFVGSSLAGMGYAGVTLAAPSAPAVMAIGAAVGTTFGVVKLGDRLLENLMPRAHRKLMGKIK